MTAPRSSTSWRPPTRRAFVSMLAAAAAALAFKDRAGLLGPSEDDIDRPRSPWTGTTRWIGHC